MRTPLPLVDVRSVETVIVLDEETAAERFQVSNPELLVPHDELTQTLETAQAFNNNQDPAKGHYLLRQVFDLQQAVRDVPGYKGIFVTGHPFYALDNETGGVHPIEEIDRFIESFKPAVDADFARGYGAWVCGACQAERDLPDLKSICKPCKIVDFKPRDIFRALPDIDVWVILDEDNPETEHLIEEAVGEAGFAPSDQEITSSVQATRRVMEALNSGKATEERLPLDMHVITRAQLLECFKMAQTNPEAEFVPIQPRSLHVNWEQAGEPYNFMKDLLFSFTPFDWQDSELSEALLTTQKAVKPIVENDIIERVGRMAGKEARQLETPAIADNLSQRIANW